ncbi:MAG: ROK family transcriptional regulator [Paracoccaceae bacterium]
MAEETEAETLKVRSLSGGVNQRGVRDFNERLLLSMIQRYGAKPGSELAKLAGLSPQTVSVILRKLEKDGLVVKGDPVRGKVGKPSTPMALAPDGVFSIGLKIGRRSATLLLMGFTGVVLNQVHLTYRYPAPRELFQFLKEGLRSLTVGLKPRDMQRLVGIGIAAPYEIWNWHELLGAPAEEFKSWQSVDFCKEIARFSDLPVSIVNDATAACRAEHVFGRGKEYRDYAYFFVGAFIGGGIVLNHSVYEGRQGNAGAFGALRSLSADGTNKALIDTASIFILEEQLLKSGLDPERLWRRPQDWTGIDELLMPWISQVGRELAKAGLSACAVIDFEAIFIDGAFPTDVRRAIVEAVRDCLNELDMRGIVRPTIEEGSIGENARALGAASGPIFNGYFLDTNVGLGDV